MGTITTGVGLISGIDTGALIDSLLAIKARGKFHLQSRIAMLQQQQSAIMDINSRLLAIKTIASSMSSTSLFDRTLATSSIMDVLSASASSEAVPGTYQFVVAQLATKHQVLSQGFASASGSHLGLSRFTMEFGNGVISPDSDLVMLNGGLGVDRGDLIIVDDATLEETVVDLSDVTTVREVITRINESGADVTATATGYGLELTHASGGAFTVSSGTGDSTAEDLGIVGSSAAGKLIGMSISMIGGGTPLGALNDGNGVLIKDNLADLVMTSANGRIFNIDLSGAIPLQMSDETLLSELNNGEGVRVSENSENPDLTIRVTNASGEVIAIHEVDLTGVETISDLKNRIASETMRNGSSDVSVSIAPDGGSLLVLDTSGEGGEIFVEGAGINATATAEDLGILREEGASGLFFGEQIYYSEPTGGAFTVQHILDAINHAVDEDGEGNGGAVVASIAADGTRLEITDATGGGGSMSLVASATNAYAISELGLDTGTVGGTITGSAILAGLDSVLINHLNGGDGLGGGTTISITDRSGASMVFNTADQYESLSTLVDAINATAEAGGVGIEVSINAAGNGLRVDDTTGVDDESAFLLITGDAAAPLGIDFNNNESVVQGENLQHKYISVATKLDELNHGKGVGFGSFRITDATGATAVVQVDSDENTVNDIIELINSRGLKIEASINATGDGIEVRSTATEAESTVAIRIATVSGTTAKDLRLLGEAASVTGSEARIDGSWEYAIDVDPADTLDDLIEKIMSAGVPVSASIINTGTGTLPFRLSLASEISGRDGRMIIDTGSIDLGLATATVGDDAKVFLGGADTADALLIRSSSNTLSDIIKGVTLDLHAVSTSPVTVTIKRDTEAIVTEIQSLVDAFNEAIDRLDAYDYYDQDTETRGPLLGDATVGRVRSALYRAMQSSAEGVESPLTHLAQIGVTIAGEGRAEFNVEKFTAAWEDDHESVEALFIAFTEEAAEDEDLGNGVVIPGDGKVVTSRGIARIFDDLLGALTDPDTGAVSRAGIAFGDQIELANDRIEIIDERLVAERARLVAQFSAMEQALAALQAQSSALGSLTSLIGR